MRQIIRLYKDSYSGLSRSSWLLAFITLINRSGMMVLPFLGLYLTEDLKFTVQQAGVVLSIFGAGSMIGSYFGGYLADRIGYFKVVLFSLIGGGICFVLLTFVQSFYLLCVSILFASIITESLRPAMTASIANYSTKENTTRSFSLIRMAINLGASIGPALAGVLAVVGYVWIFIGDGLTCIAAGIAYYIYFKKQYATHKEKNEDSHVSEIENQHEKKPGFINPFYDRIFIIFCFCTIGYAIVFFQMWNSLPLFYRNVHFLSEPAIGILLALNGFIVFVFEMPVVYSFEKKYAIKHIIAVGILLLSVAMMLLNSTNHPFILYVSMFLMSISEILAMPFMMTLIIKRSNEMNRGKYIGIYSMTWSSAFIFAPLIGTYFIEHFNYATLWWVMSSICIITLACILYAIEKMTQKTEQKVSVELIETRNKKHII
ncbi:MAG: MFS transporter [Fimbriimonadaceae bacterium]|nr:MFS transporter [Chitinophagales bacterium]